MCRIPHQRQSREIVFRRSSRREHPSRLQHGQAQFARSESGGLLKALFHPLQSEFCFLRLGVQSLGFQVIGFNNPARDSQQSRARDQMTDVCALGRVREQA